MSGQHRRGPARRSVGAHRRRKPAAAHRRARENAENHRPGRRDISGRIIAVLGLLGAAVIGLGGQGTYAYWTDMDGVSGGSFSSGTLDLTVDGVQGNPSSYVKTNLALGSMVPGESVAA